MLSNPQKSLLKRAQRQAVLSDDEYRDALELVTGFRSSRHPDFTNRQLDTVLAYLEAIYFRKIDAGPLPHNGSSAAVFRQRGFWAAKNNKKQTSRDRYVMPDIATRIAELEADLGTLGFGPAYCQAIRSKVCGGRDNAREQCKYAAALARTLRAKGANLLPEGKVSLPQGDIEESPNPF